jgi:hypothetical protein
MDILVIFHTDFFKESIKIFMSLLCWSMFIIHQLTILYAYDVNSPFNMLHSESFILY